MKIAELLLQNYKEGKADSRFRLESYMEYCYNTYKEYLYNLKLTPISYVKWLQSEIK